MERNFLDLAGCGRADGFLLMQQARISASLWVCRADCSPVRRIIF
jgi:hypothetical protein